MGRFTVNKALISSCHHPEISPDIQISAIIGLRMMCILRNIMAHPNYFTFVNTHTIDIALIGNGEHIHTILAEIGNSNITGQLTFSVSEADKILGKGIVIIAAFVVRLHPKIMATVYT